MKFAVKTGGSGSGDVGGFEERELRARIKSRDTEGIVAQFLVLLGDIDLANQRVEMLRGGKAGPSPMCLDHHRSKLWVGKPDDRRWVCPDCLWEKLKKMEGEQS